VLLGVDRGTAELDERVARRVARMFAAGLVEEVRGLPGLAQGRTASRALGYQQVLATDPVTAAVDTVRATRRFVRRQRSWFRRDPRVTWSDGAAPDLLGRALDAVRSGGWSSARATAPRTTSCSSPTPTASST
jgi:tRNA dimethylallyltransferase